MYTPIFQNLLYPLYETHIRRRNTLRYLEKMQVNQWRSHADLEREQWQELGRLLEHAWHQSDFYRDRFKTVGMTPTQITSYDDFRKLPITTRQDVLDHSERMIADNYRDQVSRKATGGSTGVPMQFALNRDSYEWRVAASQRGYQWAQCEAGQKTLYIWGIDVGNPSWTTRFKTGLYHRLFNRTMFNCFDFGEQQMRDCIATINRIRPRGIVAFTSAIYNLARFIEENDLQVAPVPAVITGAEKLFDFQRELIESSLQTRVFNTYGCREFMLIAAECEKHEGLHVSMDNLLVEILKDGEPAKPGESGDVVITDLHNYGMPFIRYQNGDIATQGSGPCSCGRGLPLIRDIDGRKMDEMMATDGRTVSGGFFPHLMKEFKEIGRFQAIQKTRTQLQIKLKLREPLPDSRLAFCRDEIRKVFGTDMEVSFEFVDDIPLTATGKQRVTISELQH